MTVTVLKAAEIEERGQTIQDWSDPVTVGEYRASSFQPVATNPFTREDIREMSDITRLARLKLMVVRGQLHLAPGWYRVVADDGTTYEVLNHSQWPRHAETVLEEVA